MARDRAARQEAKPIRLFVAVDVPDHARAALAAVVAANRDRIPGARWTRPDGWHVTLKFLGSTWPRLVDEVKAAAGSAATASERFETRLTELGVFPSARRARIVWAGVADPDGRFGRIVEDLDRRLEDYFVPEKRAFIPHLTVARLVPPRALDEFAPDLFGKPVPSKAFPVEELVLYRSHLSPAGARYEPLDRFPLGG